MTAEVAPSATEWPAWRSPCQFALQAHDRSGDRTRSSSTSHKCSTFYLDQASPVGAIAAVSTIKITLLSGARVQCNTPFGTVKP